MKHKFLFIKIILLTFFFSNFCLNAAQATKQVYIVMKVDNKIITNINIEQEYQYLLALNPALKKIKKEDALNVAKKSFLRERIKEKELKKYYNLNESKTEYLTEALMAMYQNIGLKNEAEFQNHLENFNLTIDDVKKKLGIELLWNRFIYEKFKEQVEIDMEELKKKISTNKIQKAYLLSEIVLSLRDGKNINEKYNLVTKSISVDGFKNAAIKYSISDTNKLGGAIGWLTENQLSEIILKEINKLKVGEFTKPINIPGGYIILKLEKKRDKEITLNFDQELKKRITHEKNRQLNQFSLIYYNKIKFVTKIDEK